MAAALEDTRRRMSTVASGRRDEQRLARTDIDRGAR
jgi:hypothetical protein